MSIQRAKTGDSLQSSRDEVVRGATVVVKDLDVDAEEEFTLVGIRDVDYEAGKIFVDSPLARGLRFASTFRAFLFGPRRN